jgi:hypothetical protein
MSLLSALALFACNPTGTAVVGDAPDVNDTGSNPDTTDPSNPDTDTDTEETEETEEEIPYPLIWSGTREIIFEGICEDTIYEDGEEVTKDSDFEDLLDACPTCSHIFVASTDPESICSGQVGVSSTIYRGLIYNEQGVLVVLFYDDDGRWEISAEAEGEIDGETLTYSYQGDYAGYDYTAIGEVTLTD